jgi:hypothetical protein
MIGRVLLLLFLASCSNQGEGERCTSRGDNGGNDECQEGLKCTTTGLNGVVQGAYEGRCCPPDQTQATTTICQQAASPAGGDAAVPTPIDSGAGAPDTSTPRPDAAVDAPIDAPADVQPQDAADGGG